MGMQTMPSPLPTVQAPSALDTDESIGAAASALRLEEVLTSASQSYPLLEVAIAELAAADGKALAAWGSFDSVLSGYTISKPLGFYETYRNGAKLSRPLWNGGEIYGGYRIGRGVFEPWYEERQTNEGGEFKTGVKLPFLKGYEIDGRRAKVQTAALERSRLGPDVTARIIGMQLVASQLYWKWVAAGQSVRTQTRLLELARLRNANLVERVKAGDLPKITEIDNGRFIAKRQAKQFEAQRKVQQAAIKLSLFYRDANGQPIVAANAMLPEMFPNAGAIDPSLVESDVYRALAQRPELLELEFQRQKTQVELRYAQNQTLPKLDGFAETGQDVGEPTSSLRDKSELEIEVGLIAEVPLQRRAALGKIQAAQSKLAQINAKRRFVEDKIRSQVQDAISALDIAFQRIEQSRTNLRLTRQSLEMGRARFEAGDIDIIQLNIYETSLADAELLLIDAELAYFSALADYRAALALDPVSGLIQN
jgi:outer membrane protein TolC